MSTSTTFLEIQESDVIQALSQIFLPRLKACLQSRAPGHCMRVAHLELELMIALTHKLRSACPDAQIYILKETEDNPHTSNEAELFISSTKLVELRNPLPGGVLRPPLLVFLPANIQASAEDSFGIATFEDIPVADVYIELRKHLLDQIPPPLQGYVQDLLAVPQGEWWPWADQVAQVRFLLTAIKNQVDGESLGASLYELGLVPDFRLFEDPTLMQSRVRRNLEAVRKITYSDASTRGSILELGLSDKAQQRRLIDFLMTTGVADPHAWTRQIALNRANTSLSFDKWSFIDDINRDKISLQVVDIAIPEIGEEATDERLEDLSGQKVLNPNKQPKFGVSFKVDPHPSRVPSLDHFTVQILTKDGEPVGGAKRVKAWTSKKVEQIVYLDKLNKIDFEDGWHFVRVLPWTKDDEPVSLEEPHRDLYDTRIKSYDSEAFYVLREGEVVEPPQRAIPLEYSLEHARLRMQFKELLEQRDPTLVAVKQVEWVDKAGKNRHARLEMLEVKFDRGGKYHIPVSSVLKTLEQTILREPQGATRWEWRLNLRTNGSEDPTPDQLPWPKFAAVDSFLDARTRYFEALRRSSSGKEPILQAIDLVRLWEPCLEYAEAYRDLLRDIEMKLAQSRGTDQQKVALLLRNLLLLDTVHITLTDFRGRTKEALLVGPTHPLRAFWFSAWAQVAQWWLATAREGSQDNIIPVRDALLRSLVPLNVPATLSNRDGRVFIMVDNVSPFWSLYASAGEENTRALLGEVCTLLGLPEPTISGEAISAEVLETRIARYLAQHPYIRTLSINAFNAGRAELLAQTLVLLQKRESFSQLRYDVRLFVPDPAAPLVGEAIESLLTPSTTVSTEAADAFSTPENSHLFPKLSLAIHALDDFYHRPQVHHAHLSILFDLFPAEEVSVGKPFSLNETTPVYGLIQEFSTRFRDDETGTFWQRQPRHGKSRTLPVGDDAIELLSELSGLLSGMVATVATGNPAFEQRPIVTLSLTTYQRELLHFIHDVSDWVLTIDRHLGIEFFDHGEQEDRPEYLIDFVPGNVTSSGHRLITTSRALLELRSTLQPLLRRHDLPSRSRETTIILNQLRALSGRLALKLISTPTHQSETLGLALARLFLLQQSALSNQIILPLDVHLDLFYTARQREEEISEAVTLERTDLALFDLNAATRTVRCNLVEVKCYASVGGLGAYTQLKEKITDQLKKSEEVLRYHFDPQRINPDRTDRPLKTREFATLLSFYLGRSQRYGLISEDVANEAEYFIATLEEGYILGFTKSAFIFDFEQTGIELLENEGGIEFYRIGKDQIDTLLADYSSPSVPTADGRTSLAWTSPSIPSAAFLVPQRDRSVSRHTVEYNYGLSAGEQLLAPEIDEYQPSHDEGVPISPAPSDEEQSKVDDAVLQSPNRNGSDQQTMKSAEEETKEDRDKQIQVPLLLKEVNLSSSPSYTYMLGVQETTPQYGILGEYMGRKVALDLNQTHTISLFGVQGSGKSYTLGNIIEMACLRIPHVNVLPSPLATVVFHFSTTQDYKPEFTSMVYPNADVAQVSQLHERYGAVPQALTDIVLLTPTAKVAERKREYPDLDVQPITFAASELKAMHWKFLMGAVGSQSMYIRQINHIMKKLRDKLTLEGLRQEVEASGMSDHLKELAQVRLQFASEYIDDSRKLTEVIRPGRLIIVDIRDEFIEKDEALGLFVVLLQIFSEATYQGTTFNKLVVFDEAHKYIESPDLVAGLIEVVREMRHKGTSILVASQDPPSVPVSLIELSSQIILHRCNSPAWLKHIQKANSSLNSLTPEKMSHLGAGEAYVWSARATDDAFTRGAIKIKCRPRITQHGGGTKTAVT